MDEVSCGWVWTRVCVGGRKGMCVSRCRVIPYPVAEHVALCAQHHRLHARRAHLVNRVGLHRRRQTCGGHVTRIQRTSGQRLQKQRGEPKSCHNKGQRPRSCSRPRCQSHGTRIHMRHIALLHSKRPSPALPRSTAGQRREAVVPAPANMDACRAGDWPSPALTTLPMMTSLTSAPLLPARLTASFTATAPRRVLDCDANAPPMQPMGVRQPLTMTTSCEAAAAQQRTQPASKGYN